MPVTEFGVRGPIIRLDQLLKATGLVASGGEAHAAVEQGLVQVDGKVETRKRAQLRAGQHVRLGPDSIKLVSAETG